jgi:hypothetical protein
MRGYAEHLTEEGSRLSPTVFREGEFRFFFFSREESRMHIHVIGLSSSKMKEAERLVESRKKEITDAWNNHFRS